MSIDRNEMEASSRGFSNRLTNWAAGLLLLVHIVLGAVLAWTNFIVVDEVAHVPAGLAHWRTGSLAPDRVNPHLQRMIAVLPMMLAGPKSNDDRLDERPGVRSEWLIGPDFIKANGERSFLLFRLARISGVVISAFGGLLIFVWARELYGNGGGLLALAIWAFEPTVLAYAAVATPDNASATAAVASTYLFRRALQRNDPESAVHAGIALGLAELTKFTLVVLYPAWLIAGMVWLVRSPPENPKRVSRARAIGLGAVIVATSVFVINLGYGFQGTFRRLGDFAFVSRPLAAPQPPDSELYRDATESNRLAGTRLGALRLPLPADYLSGIDVQRLDFQKSFPSYLRGQWRLRGWWYFYLYALAIKTPLGFLIMIAAAAVATIPKLADRTHGSEEAMLVIPGVLILLLVSSQIGFSHHMRYVLPMYPFWIIAAGKLAGMAERSGRIAAVLLAGLLACGAGDALRVMPHAMGYFNQLVGGPEHGHEHLLFSNVDWGQDLTFLKSWINDHPEARPFSLAYTNHVSPRDFGLDYPEPPGGPPGVYRDDAAFQSRFGPWPGYFAISAERLHEIDGRYDYFRKLEPIARAGYSIFIYHLTFEQAQAERRRLGMPPLPANDGSTRVESGSTHRSSSRDPARSRL